MKKTVEDIELKGKKVLTRADLNVPMEDGEVTNDNRIVQALPTIKYILEQGGRVILFSHLGKVKTEDDKKDKTLKPVSDKLSELLDQTVLFVPETRGTELESAIDDLKDGEILLFENTDRKSTRLNSSHVSISYAVFCLKKKKSNTI